MRAGDVRLVIRNKGPGHPRAARRPGRRALPLRSDGLTVDEEKLEPVTVADCEGEPPEAVHVLRAVNLRPGRYELFCNMSGHYLGGMDARLVVNVTMRAGPRFRPFAARGRRAVVAILVTFALFSAVSVALSIWATSRSQHRAVVSRWRRGSARSPSAT